MDTFTERTALHTSSALPTSPGLCRQVNPSQVPSENCFFKEGTIQKSVMGCMKVCHLYLLTNFLVSSDLSGKIYLVDFGNKRGSIEGQEELVKSDLEASTLQTNLWFKILGALYLWVLGKGFLHAQLENALIFGRKISVVTDVAQDLDAHLLCPCAQSFEVCVGCVFYTSGHLQGLGIRPLPLGWKLAREQ